MPTGTGKTYAAYFGALAQAALEPGLQIVWITPPSAVGNRVSGIGVQFNDQDKGRLRNKIENLLEGMIDSDISTFTMWPSFSRTWLRGDSTISYSSTGCSFRFAVP